MDVPGNLFITWQIFRMDFLNLHKQTIVSESISFRLLTNDSHDMIWNKNLIEKILIEFVCIQACHGWSNGKV